jgi:hypothetical protein
VILIWYYKKYNFYKFSSILFLMITTYIW